MYDSQKQKIQLPKPENVTICEEAPRYVGKKRGRKRKHPPEDHPPVALSSRLKATIESMDSGKNTLFSSPTPSPFKLADLNIYYFWLTSLIK